MGCARFLLRPGSLICGSTSSVGLAAELPQSIPQVFILKRRWNSGSYARLERIRGLLKLLLGIINRAEVHESVRAGVQLECNQQRPFSFGNPALLHQSKAQIHVPGVQIRRGRNHAAVFLFSRGKIATKIVEVTEIDRGPVIAGSASIAF